jgi:hypothetical protein
MKPLVFELYYDLVDGQPKVVGIGHIHERCITIGSDGRPYLWLTEYMMPCEPPKFLVRELRSRATPWWGPRRRCERSNWWDLTPALRELYETEQQLLYGDAFAPSASDRFDEFKVILPETPDELAASILRWRNLYLGSFK